MDSGSYFQTVSEVCDSWDKVKRIPTYHEFVGVALFERMFELNPEIWGFFPWTPEQFQNKDQKFLDFAAKFVRMLDMSIDMLGPDMEVVEEQLYELGRSHQRYGVTPKHFDLMGKALIQTLKKILGSKAFTETAEKSWKEIYSFMSMTMIQGAAGI